MRIKQKQRVFDHGILDLANKAPRRLIVDISSAGENDEALLYIEIHICST